LFEVKLEIAVEQENDGWECVLAAPSRLDAPNKLDMFLENNVNIETASPLWQARHATPEHCVAVWRRPCASLVCDKDALMTEMAMNLLRGVDS